MESRHEPSGGASNFAKNFRTPSGGASHFAKDFRPPSGDASHFAKNSRPPFGDASHFAKPLGTSHGRPTAAVKAPHKVYKACPEKCCPLTPPRGR